MHTLAIDTILIRLFIVSIYPRLRWRLNDIAPQQYAVLEHNFEMARFLLDAGAVSYAKKMVNLTY